MGNLVVLHFIVHIPLCQKKLNDISQESKKLIVPTRINAIIDFSNISKTLADNTTLYELPQELPNDLRLRILGNREILRKRAICVEPSAQSAFWKLSFCNSSPKAPKSRYQTFLFLSSFIWFLCFIPNIWPRIIWGNKILGLDPPSLLILIFWHFLCYHSIFTILKENINQFSCVKLSVKLSFGNISPKTCKSRYQTFLFLSDFTGYLCFIPNILTWIVWGSKSSVLTRRSLLQTLVFDNFYVIKAFLQNLRKF